MFKNDKVKLDNFEVRVIINALNEKRTKLLSIDEDTEILDELILKYINVLDRIRS